MGTRVRRGGGMSKKRPPVPLYPGTVMYPSGCQDVSHDMKVEELIRRLKVLSTTFQTMEQIQNDSYDLIPLCLHLIQKEFLHHSNKVVQLNVACIIADILRVFAPNAPYKDRGQIEAILIFLIRQLEGLKEKSDPNFKRYFYLLENLAIAKSFFLCFQLYDSSEVLCKLFDTILKIARDLEQPGKVMSCMLDLLSPILKESDTISDELLDIILQNSFEPMKSSKKTAYNLTKLLITSCEETLKPCIHTFFNQVLIIGQDIEDISLAEKAYDLIYELYKISPSIISAVIPLLEFKLKSTEKDERLASTSVLGIIFSEQNSTFAAQHPQIWQIFLARFSDIDVAIRIKCVHYSTHFLLNHLELRVDIVKALETVLLDFDAGVRLEVVKSVIATARSDFSILSENQRLLDNLIRSLCDKMFKIRKESLQGLSLIYKGHLTALNVQDTTKRAITLITNKILHTYYYIKSTEDRMLIERCLNTCLVPYQLESEERMKKLLYLFGTFDELATKAFTETQKTVFLVKRGVRDMLKCIREMSQNGKERHLNIMIHQLSKFLPDPVKGSEFLSKFSVALKESPALLTALEIIVNDDTDCKTITEKINFILKKLGPATATNFYYKAIQGILERTSSLLVDKGAIRKLVDLLHQIIEGQLGILRDLGMDCATTIERGLRLIFIWCFAFPKIFCEVGILQRLIQLLTLVPEDHQPSILSTLTSIGKQEPICKYVGHGDLIHDLRRSCEEMIVSGTPKQAKEAIRCLYANLNEVQIGQSFTSCLSVIDGNLNPNDQRYRTSIVAFGHIAEQAPVELGPTLRRIIARKIVKDLVINPSQTNERRNQLRGSWCEKSNLPEITLSRMEGLKATYRWLVGLKTDRESQARKTFKLLTAIVESGGVFESNVDIITEAEKSWLRLTAGCCMLKISGHAGIGDQYNALQFCALSRLMIDDVLEVRQRFATKLYRGLSRGIPAKCLPLEFLGFYALAGYETDQNLKATIKEHIVRNVNTRREYIQCFLAVGSENVSDHLHRIMPDYMLSSSVAFLTHNPNYTDHTDHQELSLIKECLWFILEPLILKNTNYSFTFYKSLIEGMKNRCDAMMPNCDVSNNKMYAICDIAYGLILKRSTHFDTGNSAAIRPVFPLMFFKPHEDRNFVNRRVYIPKEISTTESNKAGITFQMISPVAKKSRKRSKPSTPTAAEVVIPEPEPEEEVSTDSIAKRTRTRTSRRVRFTH